MPGTVDVLWAKSSRITDTLEAGGKEMSRKVAEIWHGMLTAFIIGVCYDSSAQAVVIDDFDDGNLNGSCTP